jgi:uridine kinase
MTSRIVAVVGGTASGKTTLASDLFRIGGADKVQVIPLDAYYRCNAHLPADERAKVNYDHPDAFEIELLIEHLMLLRSGDAVDTPTYNFATHSRASHTKRLLPQDVIIIEGILTLHFPDIRNILSYSVFVDTPDELRFSRRLSRDVRERGRTEESVITQWNETVQPMHEKFCAPTKQFASELIDGSSWTDDDVITLWQRVRG